MIRLSRLNGSSFILNCELIETVEETPDSVITTVNGKKFVVAESAEEIVLKIIEYKNRLSFAGRVPDTHSK